MYLYEMKEEQSLSADVQQNNSLTIGVAHSVAQHVLMSKLFLHLSFHLSPLLPVAHIILFYFLVAEDCQSGVPKAK